MVRKADIVLIASYVVITGIMAYFLVFNDMGSSSSQRILYIQQEGIVIERITLPTSEVIRKKIRIGIHYNDIVINRNKIYIEDSDCKDKLCISQGEIFRSGQMIACLPNKLVLEIKNMDNSKSDSPVDAVTN